jgi:LysM repeat protein
MFDKHTRRHPVQSFHFWFVVLTCFFGGLAWKLEILPELWPNPGLPVMTDEPMPPPPAVRTFEAQQSMATSDAASPPHDEPTQAVRATGVMPATEKAEVASSEAPTESPPEQVESIEPADSALSPVRTAMAVEAELPAEILPVKAEAPKKAEDVLPAVSATPPEPVLDLTEVDQLLNAGQEIQAHRLLSHWYWTTPGSRPLILDRLNFLARRIYFQPEPHYLPPHLVQFGEKPQAIAAKYHLTAEYLAKLNRIDLQKLQAGQKLKVVPGPFSAVIETNQKLLTLHSQGYFVAAFPCEAVNLGSSGTSAFVIVEKGADLQATPWLKIRDSATGSLELTLREAGADTQNIEGDPLPGFRFSKREMAALLDLLRMNAEVIVK